MATHVGVSPRLTRTKTDERNQEVLLTTVEPAQKLKIHSITSDYGLLRCTPISETSTSTKGSNGLTPLYSRGDYGDDDRSIVKRKNVDYVDLQPDGNSFDLMAGLIKRKV